jgi:hypothetical protein
VNSPHGSRASHIAVPSPRSQMTTTAANPIRGSP